MDAANPERSVPSDELKEFQEALGEIQAATTRRIGNMRPELDESAVRERLIKGLPLLGAVEFRPDRAILRDTLAGLLALFTQHAGLFGVGPEDLKSLNVAEMESVAPARAREGGGDTAAGESPGQTVGDAIIEAALKPFLRAFAAANIGLVKQELWRRGYCPVCGGTPDFGFLEKESGGRWLVCARCDSQWLFQRLECPFCGNQDQNALSYFTDEAGLYRLYVCERCQGYLKAIDLRQAKGEVSIAAERSATADMDRQALEGGYHLPARVTTAAPR